MMSGTSSNSFESLRISISEDSDQLRSMFRWLRAEDALKGTIEATHQEIGPGEMGGGVLEAIIVTVGSGGTFAALARSLSTWITHRHSDIRVTVTSADGATIELDAKRADPEALTRQLSQLITHPEETQ